MESRGRETIKTRQRSPAHTYIARVTICERGVEETKSRILRLGLLSKSLRHHIKPRSLAPRMPCLEVGIGNDFSLLSIQLGESVESWNPLIRPSHQLQ